MRFDCNRRKRYLQGWHLWFAWCRINVGGSTCCWLEYVWRIGKRHETKCTDQVWWTWEYRLRYGD